jgi:hypothetical protein
MIFKVPERENNEVGWHFSDSHTINGSQSQLVLTLNADKGGLSGVRLLNHVL